MDSRYGRGFSGGGGNGNGNGGGGGGVVGGNHGAGQYRRYSRSRSRSRERNREHGGYRRHNSRSRSRERSSHYNRHSGGSQDKDLYRDLIDDDYQEERNYNSRNNSDNRQHRSEDNYDRREDNYDNNRDQRWKNYERQSRERNSDYDRGNERNNRGADYRHHNNGNNGSNNAQLNNNRDRDRERDRERRYSSDDDSDNDATDESQYRRKHHRTCNEAQNNIILFGLQKHVTEADIMGELIKVNMEPTSIRVMRKQPTGASRCFAFVEFKTVEESRQWMEITKGTLQLGDHRVSMQYTRNTRISDWTCVKCGATNFKRRLQCFMCNVSREESENVLSGAGEGIDEVSRILTKKIMLRNLDALTNEEGVLTALQQLQPKLAKSVSKVLISRDTLTQASRGICYLHFDTLVDSMELHNALTALDPPLTLDDREVAISYCVDVDDRPKIPNDSPAATSTSVASGGIPNGSIAAVAPSGAGGSYTLADVPRLAEYSASLYASNPEEQAHYVQYYTDYYTAEIAKSGPSDPQLTEANSGAAVALSAIQRKQKKMSNIETTATAAAIAAAQAAAEIKATFATQNVVAPRGNDGKTYPAPDVSRYQYDETSGYYFDPSTGLYYDAHSQYYYNNETGAYLYWDQRRSTYILATPASTQAALQEVLAEAEQKDDDSKKDKEKDKEKDGNNKHDKVKVAKKIVKDMEKWAKQLNQKKDYTVVATPHPILTGSEMSGPSTSRSTQGSYADVGFSILEKKERAKLTDFMPPAAPLGVNKLFKAYGGGSESDEDTAGPPAAAVGGSSAVADEMDFVDLQKLTCLLCKRAFQSLEILQKHLKMSNLHKENLAKLNQGSGASADADPDPDSDAGLSYRDRAKERRLKYGESDPPPPNRSRERFEQEIKTLQTRQKNNASAASALPISSNNVGNRLMQKMGWTEGQGLGRKNQGRTQIIEADGRTKSVGLGNKVCNLPPGTDYKSYIKKMMKQRYENA
ncbi:RNA-binding protein 5-B-like isoform X1 [Drosophila persimilis]|uniref:RNA-binding protein 5-B-like isoform X1 n=2 Tax=Drosophila persimilis TaxID=7234 RepID=UPI000F07F93B|nr:RNA-binding protein 5-B-like isoform X1 [Drosophila persimilis]XP_026844886.1 RNA-binding protein 5-B-like isoform X1 [Drosophila persimilis]